MNDKYQSIGLYITLSIDALSFILQGNGLGLKPTRKYELLNTLGREILFIVIHPPTAKQKHCSWRYFTNQRITM
jgi:hypothetical protein